MTTNGVTIGGVSIGFSKSTDPSFKDRVISDLANSVSVSAISAAVGNVNKPLRKIEISPMPDGIWEGYGIYDGVGQKVICDLRYLDLSEKPCEVLLDL